MRFDGKLVLVTGATSGIGRAGAERLAAEGARLVLTGRDPRRLDVLREAIASATVVADDAAAPDAGDALAALVSTLGPLDGLWLNAGHAEVGPLDQVDAATVDALFAANVRGPVLQMAHLAPHLAPGASVLVTASTAAYEGAAVASVYAATKGALVSVVRTWATALAERAIRVNTLVPGAVDTDFRAFMSDDERAAYEAAVLAKVPLSRVGTPAEAAAVALFLLSDESSYVTASQYAVDGGLTHR